ncbi:MAG: WS/DGAT domain-containing protein, partial [Acidimicrobiales bacterium]
AIFSYDGKVTFGVTADFDSTPDIAVLTDGINAGMEEMLAAARQATAADQDVQSKDVLSEDVQNQDVIDLADQPDATNGDGHTRNGAGKRGRAQPATRS